MSSTEITTLPANGDVAAWSDAEKAIVEAAGLVFTHNYGPREGEREAAPRAVVERFLHACRVTGLDPLTRQIYCVGRLSGGSVEWSIQTGIDGYRVTAERSGKYLGQTDPEWMLKDGTWVDVFVKEIHGDHPLAARVRILRDGWDQGALGIATWESYVQTKRDGTPTAMWLKMGPAQLAKCAEALGFRKAFPQDLSGIYTREEMEQAENDDASLNGDETQAVTATPPARKRATNGTQGTKRAPAKTPADLGTAMTEGLADGIEQATAEGTDPGEPAGPITAAEVEDVIDAEIVEDDDADKRTPAEIERDEKDAVAMSAPSAEPIDQQAALDRAAAEQEEARKRTVAANVAAAKEEGARKRAEREAEEEAELRAADAEAAMSAAQAAEAMAADTTTGEVPEETPAEVDARLKAARAARGASTKAEAQAEVQAEPEPWGEPDPADDAPSEYDVATAEEPENWERRLLAATKVEQVKAVWDEASLKPGAMTTELRKSIIAHKARVNV